MFDWAGTSESSPSVGSSGESVSVIATGGGATLGSSLRYPTDGRVRVSRSV